MFNKPLDDLNNVWGVRPSSRLPRDAQSELSSSPGHDALALQQRLERLSLLCQAMWELLREHGGVTDAMLSAKVDEIDARDGKVDGRRTPTVDNCPKCKRTINRRLAKCQYCGAPIEFDSPFEKQR